MDIGSIWAALRIDGSKAKADATKAGEQAGDAAAAGMGSRLKKGAAVIGAAVAGGLTVALTGRMVALERATADFRKETGATAAEAAKASKAINDMASRNLQSIEDIGATLTVVTKDWGLHGDAAAKAAEQVLKYAQATGTDAVQAARDFDDLQDRLGITAGEVADVMDRLIANNQKYGGSIADQQQALADLAPVLNATNTSWQDGIGLLGFFETAGIDAAAAATGLTRAVKTLEPGQGIQDLLDQISSIEDPAKRATEATRLFGRGAGPQLADALSHGTVKVSDFTASLGDVKGKTTEAADASLTFADRIKQAFSGIISTATEVLGPAGPLLTAIGGLAPLLGPAFKTVFKALGGTLKLSLKALGSLMGSTIGAEMVAKVAGALTASALPGGALALAAAAAVVAVPVVLNFVLKDRNVQSLDDYTGDLGLPKLGMTGWDEFQNDITMARQELSGLRDDLGLTDKEMDALATNAAAALYGTTLSVKDAVGAALLAWRDIRATVKAAEDAGMTTGEAYATGVLGGSARKMGEGSAYLINYQYWQDHAEEAGAAAAQAAADGIERNAVAITDTWGRIAKAVKVDYGQPVNAGKRATELMLGTMAGFMEPWKQAWRDTVAWVKDPFKPKQFEEWTAERVRKLHELAAKEMDEGRPRIARRAELAAEAWSSPIIKAVGGLKVDIGQVIAAMLDFQRLNERIGPEVARMGTTTKVAGRASGGPVEAGVPYWVGENHRPELFVPDQPGYIIPDVSAVKGEQTIRLEVDFAPGTVRQFDEHGWDARGAMQYLSEVLRTATASAPIRSLAPRGL